ncbi:anthranilate synthase component II [Candidatus Contubernalis alkaliaceticus]|uniref:anthranilate synthase component II n=1 Tax=Candidatus Contubernalis alkaliaceticus TaxID=338645 RepID=UPI001F4BDD79|nr:aminodeoxychorismate/anthranilate synthase component II [Candidatus Contubernalis alkalaceticus]UNC92608.1 aminodeoxychorismate/anthranilate synthase component II [Candidatus Contubernalis alkalaceticus]
MILVIDNYDSFTYNLVQYLGEMGAELTVARNDKITLEEINVMSPEKIVISPGPGIPQQAGLTIDIIRDFYQKVPILGVCLGHQAIGAAFGGEVVGAATLMHGKTSLIYHQGGTLYRGIPSPFEATRYHSLIIEENSMPSCLEITSRTEEGTVMGVRHRDYPLEGIQFHPESILTAQGKRLLSNFLKEDVKVA